MNGPQCCTTCCGPLIFAMHDFTGLFFFLLVARMYGYGFNAAGMQGMVQKKRCEQQGNEGWGSMEGVLNRNPQTIQ